MIFQNYYISDILKHQMSEEYKIQNKESKVYMVCLNPHCLKDKQRCLTSISLHYHPTECSHYLYPAQAIIEEHWTKLDHYPNDNLGKAVQNKYIFGSDGYLKSSIQQLRQKIEQSLKDLQNRILQLYPDKQLFHCYSSVYSLQKVAQCLRLKKNPMFISGLINSNFSAHNYHSLLRLNENYDDIRNGIDGLNKKLMQHFDVILERHRSYQMINQGKRVHAKKINYGVYKSKFIASSKIQFQKSVVTFPKIKQIASFLPWIYTDKSFTQGTHDFKITSLKYPLIQNAGFTILEERDIDTYPYSNFKSLFNQQGKGFELINGEHIHKFMAQTTVVILRLQLGPLPKAYIFDSLMNCQYQCQLSEKTSYRMGVYGCGWSMQVIQLN